MNPGNTKLVHHVRDFQPEEYDRTVQGHSKMNTKQI